KIKRSSPYLLLYLAQCLCLGRTRWVAPERVGRDDRIGRPLMNGVVQLNRYATFGGFDVFFSNIFQALCVSAKAETPLGLDRAGRSLFYHVDNVLACSAGNLAKCCFHRCGSSRIALSIERHVG